MFEILKILFEISKDKELTNISIDYETGHYNLKIKANGKQFSLVIDTKSLKSVQYQASLYNKLMEGLNNVEEV